MKKIILKKLTIQNFKGCVNRTIDFSDKTYIKGANATGKTTIFDAVTFLLFGKDSAGSEKFEIRPLDADGNKIHNIEISVEGEFLWEFDGETSTRTLKKVQREKWVKKRGSGVAELQGNENTYEVDGYPRSEKEYKEVVSSWVDESVFKMITNPQYFPNMPWKDQRSILMLLVSEQSDAELAKTLGGYDEILDELEKAPSTDDILSKYKKSMTELKKTQAELPVRIDEASKQKVDIDLAELELQKSSIKEQIDAENALMQGTSDISERIIAINKEVSELKANASSLTTKANAEYAENKARFESDMTLAQSMQRQAEIKKSDIERSIAHDTEMISKMESQTESLRGEYAKTKALEFDESSDTCPMCKQMLPKDQIAKHREDFEVRKNESLERIQKDGKSCADLIKTIKERLESNKGKLEEVTNEIDKHKIEAQSLNDIIADMHPVSVEDTDEYKDIMAKLEEKGEELTKLNIKVSETTDSARAHLTELNQSLREVEIQIASADRNNEIDERILALQGEQKVVAQKVMDCEKIIYLVEQFIKAKMDAISGQINSKFDGVNWKLFEAQINGGLKETCECTVNGVPYASANNGHRIVAGLQIIKTLQTLNEVMAPIFIDNAESVNSFNYPQMDNQMVFLEVTEDKELQIA